MKMSKPVALKRIRALTQQSHVVPSTELPGRMRKRQITWAEIIKVLLQGWIVEGPALDIKGCWRCTMKRFAAGEDVTVVVSICDDTLVVITTF